MNPIPSLSGNRNIRCATHHLLASPVALTDPAARTPVAVPATVPSGLVAD